MRKDDKFFVGGLILLGLGLFLSSNPKCDKGCQTVAQHLVDHGLDDLIAGLLA